ncbi:DUF72 domain-containing protein [Halospeciosus flavus]|uniref:DUF72 domain-containing protein n=1 Tax=Halospeciosus flavus TaxID=3032283 RepID=A0ABD5Z202_9EURY|nr:DUF72 domain-containing protein [Halospeciosus flavus]
MAEFEIGVCGYGDYRPGEGWKAEYDHKLQAYADEFDAVELNRTFYELPQVSTSERWREVVDEMNEEFTFLLKGWQALTHPSRSPTWNNHRDAEPEGEKGYFRPTETVFDAWERTRDHAEALDAPAVLLQTPAGFDCTDEHAENLREFVDGIDRGGRTLAWEPRGDWKANLDSVEALCTELDLIHVTDLSRRFPSTTDADVAYVRFHGLNEDPYDYDYDYSDEELDEIADRMGTLGDEYETVYAMFNNYEKVDNARSLREKLGV